jgi:glutamate-5-semialdehyde dehydrogenase
LGDASVADVTQVPCIENDLIWYEEFLDYKIVIGTTNWMRRQSKRQILWWHSASIITKNEDTASKFMENVDTAAVYHNASTRLMAANLA